MSPGVDTAAELVTVRSGAPVAEITVGNATKRNALTGAGWARLKQGIDALADDGVTRVIVLRGRSGTFCAGSDMTEWVGAGTDAVEDSFARMEAAFRSVEDCSVPVVADVRGVAAGAGCQLALACDMRFMADTARIGMPVVRLGINASPAFAARMVTLAGPSRARQLLYTGELLGASAAVDWGLADQALPEAELGEYTARVSAAIAEQPPAAVRAAKQAVTTALAPTRRATTWQEGSAVDPDAFPAAIADLFGG